MVSIKTSYYYFVKEGKLYRSLSPEVPLETDLVVYSEMSSTFFTFTKQWETMPTDDPRTSDLKSYLLLEGVLNA